MGDQISPLPETACGIYKPASLATLSAMTILWANGQWLDALEFSFSPMDRGVTVGLGLFETILAVDGEPIFAAQHLARLRASCERLGWLPNLPDCQPILRELIQRNHLTHGRARIRLAITGGSGSIHDLTLGSDHAVWITAVRAANAPPTTSANLSPWMRNERSPLAGLKCASYAENLVALADAARLGFEETVFLNTRGQLCETATANLFVVKNGQLLTPSPASGCLPGITRGVVIELAGQLGIACTQGDLSLLDLQTADECFLTSSIRGLMGLDRFERTLFPPGPLTQALREAWHTATRRQIQSC